MKTLLAWFLGLPLLVMAGAQPVAPYGEPVRFRKDRVVEFVDFSVRYLGERRVEDPMFKPGFIFHDFEIRSPKSVRTVSWSSGTGVIDSVEFTVDGSVFDLELRGSVARKGWLRDDEMVVWPHAKFLEALAAARKPER